MTKNNTKKIRVFEAFAGYGSQSIALRNLGIPHEVVAISEIDKYAIQAYEAIHGKVNNLGDVSKIKVEDIPEHDLFTYSFPCQDISVAGNTKGIIEGETRSGLLYECKRIIEHRRPKYLLLENVKNLVGKKFKGQFDEWLKYLEGLGYTNYWKVVNAKDCGVPQNRERVFVVSILGEHKPYEFPKSKVTRDIREYLDGAKNEDLNISEKFRQQIKNTNFKKDYYKEDTFNLINGNIEGFKIMDYRYDEGLRIRKNNLCPTLTTRGAGGLSGTPIIYNNGDFRFLSEREYLKLMGLYDDDINKIQDAKISPRQQYKMAGNSIVVDVLEGIFKNLFL